MASLEIPVSGKNGFPFQVDNILSAKAVSEVARCKHAQSLGHFRKALPIRDDFGADGRFAVEGRVGHLVDESLHRNDVAGNLLLEL
jgi:hypothetical protein